MSRLFEALQQSGGMQSSSALPVFEFATPTGAVAVLERQEVASLEEAPRVAISAAPERRLFALREERGAGAEKIRMLIARLKQMQQRRALKKLLISSSIKAEGKSLISTNTAIALARSNQRVLLIDGDCHQPQLAGLFGVSNSPGLSAWWRGNDSILKSLRRVEGLPLWFLTAGAPLENSLEMLQSERMAQLMDELAGWFDWVIVDSPPLGPVADSALWAGLADGVILVVRRGITPKRVLARILDTVDRAKLLGIVLNDAADPEQRYYAQYYARPAENA